MTALTQAIDVRPNSPLQSHLTLWSLNGHLTLFLVAPVMGPSLDGDQPHINVCSEWAGMTICVVPSTEKNWVCDATPAPNA